MSALVGLIGKKRSGKDSLAGTLIEEFGFERFAFADPLKEAVLAVNPIVFHAYSQVSDDPRVTLVSAPVLSPRPRRLRDVVAREGWEVAKENREIRRLLQEYGVAIREIQEDFWLDATMEPATRHASEVGPVVVTDVRFPNEAHGIRDAGGTIVRISRPGLISTDTHASETALDDFQEDLLVENDGSLEALAGKARALMLSLL